MKSEDYSKIVEQVKALSDADRERLLTYLRSLTGSACLLYTSDAADDQ